RPPRPEPPARHAAWSALPAREPFYHGLRKESQTIAVLELRRPRWTTAGGADRPTLSACSPRRQVARPARTSFHPEGRPFPAQRRVRDRPPPARRRVHLRLHRRRLVHARGVRRVPHRRVG